VDRALLEELLKTAMWAPSGMNRQPWKFLVLEGGALERFVQFSIRATDSMLEPLRVQGFNEKMQKFIQGYFRDLGGAKTVVVCLSKSSDTYLKDHADMVSCAAAFSNFLLLAHEAGLATCWMTGYVDAEEELMRLLGVSGYKLVGATPVGYADQTPPVPPRKGEDIVWLSS
jgi:nitroreductase